MRWSVAGVVAATISAVGSQQVPSTNLYISHRQVFLEIFDVMHNACEKGDRPLKLMSHEDAASMQRFLSTQPPGLYALNSFAGPKAWTGVTKSVASTELGYLDEHNVWKPSSGIPGAQQYFRSHYGGNHNVQCGGSRPSWDPVVARVQGPGVVEFPRSTNDKTAVLNCYHDGYDQRVSVVCAKPGPPPPCSIFEHVNRACPIHALGRVV
eukprot:COSAG01_NODE_27574_length_682_cov_0.998285_1_plen_208_part_01